MQSHPLQWLDSPLMHQCLLEGVSKVLLENVEDCGGEPEQADTGLMSAVIHQVNHPPTCTSIHHSQEDLKVWFTNLSWHIAGSVTIAKFQNAQ